MTRAEAGNIGEEQVREVLRELKGTLISGFIRSNNLKCDLKNFQFDFLTLIPSIGLVVLEVKHWKGTIKATGNQQWKQEIDTPKKTFKNELPNASTQAIRTSGLLMQLLEKEKMNKWPIRPLVVFSNSKSTILKGKDDHAPQTDIILKSMIPAWIKDNSIDDVNYNFRAHDFKQVKSIIQKYTAEYISTSQ